MYWEHREAVTYSKGRSITMGKVAGIFIGKVAGEPMQTIDEAMAIAGSGLDGDRYANKSGFYSDTPTVDGARELTLIAEEAIAAVVAHTTIPFSAIESRRNILTSGIDLDSLIGKRFALGGAVCEGVRSCPPCNHLESLIEKAVMRPLARSGGIRARIVQGGVIRIGDDIRATGPSSGPTAGSGPDG
jgi:MOSC domain-containing protein YiiM